MALFLSRDFLSRVVALKITAETKSLVGIKVFPCKCFWEKTLFFHNSRLDWCTYEGQMGYSYTLYLMHISPLLKWVLESNMRNFGFEILRLFGGQFIVLLFFSIVFSLLPAGTQFLPSDCACHYHFGYSPVLIHKTSIWQLKDVQEMVTCALTMCRRPSSLLF